MHEFIDRLNHYKGGIVIVLNIVDFKMYQLVHGMQAGNDLAQRVLMVLKRRYGLAEFSGSFYVYDAGDNWLAHLKETLEYLPAMQTGVSFVIGSFENAVLRAEYAMRKSRPGVILTYSDAMKREVINQNYILTHLEDALANNNIQMFLQPVVDASTGKLTSAEALARWQKGDKFLAPGTFIPFLEDRCLVYKIDQKMACDAADFIKRTGIPVSINISRTDFDVFDLVAWVSDLNVDPEKLIIEITESAVLENRAVITDAIEKFRNKGYKVWMDDFGSGYSNLSELSSLNFDRIKIDMSFMKNFDEDFLTALYKMTAKLNIATLQEGVETPKQAAFLKQAGCGEIQGYLYDQPLAVSDFVKKWC